MPIQYNTVLSLTNQLVVWATYSVIWWGGAFVAIPPKRALYPRSSRTGDFIISKILLMFRLHTVMANAIHVQVFSSITDEPLPWGLRKLSAIRFNTVISHGSRTGFQG